MIFLNIGLKELQLFEKFRTPRQENLQATGHRFGRFTKIFPLFVVMMLELLRFLDLPNFVPGSFVAKFLEEPADDVLLSVGSSSELSGFFKCSSLSLAFSFSVSESFCLELFRFSWACFFCCNASCLAVGLTGAQGFCLVLP